ncbi:MAG: PD-(D/E)XK nuclease family protein [Deltaproteobacteria bacterium]|nr:PD-(D/E)XK nuclease family protein [Deltaproteobacteria bacterium]
MPARRLSASQISTWLACNRKFAFRYVEHAPREHRPSALAFGSAVHSAIDWFHGERLEGGVPPPDKAAAIFRADWDAELDEPVRFKDDESPEALRETGETLVRLYAERMAAVPIEATELPFEVPLVDLSTGEVLSDSIRGFIDLLLPDDRLVEIKTSARRISDSDLRRRLQLSAYAYAHRLKHGRSPQLTVISLGKGRRPSIEVQTTERTLEDDAFFVHLASEAARGMDSGAYPPNPGWMCGDCEYAASCAAWRGSAPTRSVIPDALEETRIALGGHPWTATVPIEVPPP